MNRRIAQEGRIRVKLLYLMFCVAAALSIEPKDPSNRLLQQVSLHRNSRLGNSLLANPKTMFKLNTHHQPVDYSSVANSLHNDNQNSLLSQLQKGHHVVVQSTFFSKQAAHQNGPMLNHLNNHLNNQPTHFPLRSTILEVNSYHQTHKMNWRHGNIHHGGQFDHHMNTNQNGIIPLPIGHGNHFGNKFQDPRLGQLFPDGNGELVKKPLTDQERGNAIFHWINPNPPKDDNPHDQVPLEIDPRKFDHYNKHTPFQRLTIAHIPDHFKPQKKSRFAFNSPSGTPLNSNTNTLKKGRSSSDAGYMSGSSPSSGLSSSSAMSISSDSWSPTGQIIHQFPKGHIMAN